MNRQRYEKELEFKFELLSKTAKEWLVDAIAHSWEDMELPAPPGTGTNFDEYVEHYDIKFRAFDVDHGRIGQGKEKYTTIIAYLDNDATFIWGPWNGETEDKDSWYWESCSHCVPLLGMYDSFKRKKPRY